VAAQS